MPRNGYMGRFLRVDLSTGRATPEEVPQAYLEAFIGGRGLNSALLFREVSRGTDPLSPQNKLIIGTGPGNGTTIPGSTRFTMTAKSPLTGLLGDCNSGADFGVGLKHAGYDGIIVEGQSPKPVFLWINDGEAELRPAGHLWGRNAMETHLALKREVGNPDAKVIAIGRAGERLVSYASVIGGGTRVSGRTGMGTVMGSKRLKAIVATGTQGVRVADRRALEDTVKLMDERMTTYGSMGLLRKYQEAGMLASYNFRQGTLPEVEDLYAESVKERFFSRNRSCFSCPLGCFHTYHVSEGPYAGTFGEHLEFGGTAFAGARLGNPDPALVLRINSLMNDYGLDMADTTACIAFVIECYQNGILSSEELGGLRPEWGDPETILGLIEMIAHRQGIGELLSQGMVKAAEAIGRGSERFAMHSKGMSLTAKDPRVGNAWGFAFSVASRGADHTRSFVACEQRFDPKVAKILPSYTEVDPFSIEGKAELVVFHEHLRAV